MNAVICIFVPGLLLLLLKIKLFQNGRFYIYNILQYLGYTILLNILSLLILIIFFSGTEDLIYKLNNSISLAFKYFLLSLALATSILVVELLPSKIELNKRMLSIITMVFIYIPVIIFLFGFTKIYWAILTSICIFYGFNKLIKTNYSESKEEVISIDKKLLLICFFLCLAIGIICGWGGLFQQTDDWHKANAVLRDLVNYEWPVYYVNGSEHSALSYYIGGYLIPALVGKLFHSFDIAEFAMLIYFTFGLFILFLNELIYVRVSDNKNVIIFFIGMILFSGAIILAQDMVYLYYPDMNYIGVADILAPGLRLQYRSTMINLQWVPTQYIFPCLAGAVFLHNRKNVSLYVWFLLPALLYSGFSFIGIVPIALLVALIYVIKKEIQFKDIFSISNISMSLSLGLILIFYFWGNITSEKPNGWGFRFVNYDRGRLLGVYLFFCLFMFGIQAIIIWKRNKQNPIFFCIIAMLLIIPFEAMGIAYDWVLGVPTISLFFLMLFIWEFIFHAGQENIKKGILIALLCIGAIYSIRSIQSTTVRSIKQYCEEGYFNGRADDYETMQKYANRFANITPSTLVYNYFNYDLDNDIFYLYIARKQ